MGGGGGDFDFGSDFATLDGTASDTASSLTENRGGASARGASRGSSNEFSVSRRESGSVCRTNNSTDNPSSINYSRTSVSRGGKQPLPMQLTTLKDPKHLPKGYYDKFGRPPFDPCTQQEAPLRDQSSAYGRPHTTVGVYGRPHRACSSDTVTGSQSSTITGSTARLSTALAPSGVIHGKGVGVQSERKDPSQSILDSYSLSSSPTKGEWTMRSNAESLPVRARYIYLSYAAACKNEHLVFALNENLKFMGYNVYCGTGSVDKSMDTRKITALDDAALVVMCITRQYHDTCR